MKNEPSDLIIGHLNGTLDEHEQAEFYVWVFANEENKKLFFDAKMIFDAKANENKKIDIEESWDRLVDKKYPQRYRISLFSFKQLLRYAAVAIVAILFTSTIFIYKQHITNESITYYVGGNGIEADKLVLPDGSKVSVGANTVLEYSNDFGKSARIVHLKGEAFFDIAKKEKIPFIVKIDGQQVEALGTKFNVLAYPSDSLFKTTLLEGSLKISTLSNNSYIILKPDEQLVYNRRTQHTAHNNVDASLYTSWVEGYYYFPEQNIEDILERLAPIYGISYEIRSKQLEYKKFTGTFYRGQSIKEILEIINISIPIKHQIKENHLIIYN